jgi:thiol-disulfide isomerase/thioredoxin
MKNKFLITLIVIAATLPARFVFADATADADVSTQLKALVMKVRTDIQAGKTTEAALSDDLKQFDVLLAQHKGEKTDAVAQILYVKATLYAEVIQNTAKADALMKQLTNDYSGTAFVAMLQKQQAQESAVSKIQASLKVGSQFPNFSVKDVTGKPLSLADFKGKVVMIDFWATWCGPCRQEVPNVVATYQKYHDKGFDIIGISLDQEQQKLLDFTKQNNMTWRQYFDGQGWSNQLAVKYGIESIPMDFLLDGNGKIIGKNLRGDALEAAVAKAVGQ